MKIISKHTKLKKKGRVSISNMRIFRIFDSIRQFFCLLLQDREYYQSIVYLPDIVSPSSENLELLHTQTIQYIKEGYLIIATPKTMQMLFDYAYQIQNEEKPKCQKQQN